MKSVSGKEMCRILQRHGWVLDHVSKSSHHIFKKPGPPGNVVVPVHGNQALKTGTQRAIMRAAGLSEADL